MSVGENHCFLVLSHILLLQDGFVFFLDSFVGRVVR